MWLARGAPRFPRRRPGPLTPEGKKAMERRRWEADRRDPRVRRQKNPRGGRGWLSTRAGSAGLAQMGWPEEGEEAGPFEKKKKLEREKEKEGATGHFKNYTT